MYESDVFDADFPVRWYLSWFAYDYSLETDRVECELTWIPDGIIWDFVDWGNPIIPNSPNPDAYDTGCVYAATAPLLTDAGIQIYYGGGNDRHWTWRDSFLCLAWLRQDGWTGYTPVDSAQSAVIVTNPVDCGSGLSLTADAAAGSVAVSVVGGDGMMQAQSMPISDDVTDYEVTFDGLGLAAFVGQPVQVQFELRSAKLYSFNMRAP